MTPEQRAEASLSAMNAMTRPYTRVVEGQPYRFVLRDDFRVEEKRLLINVRVYQGTNQQGPVVLEDLVRITEPRVYVPDGEEPNVDGDPQNPINRAVRTKKRYDPAEAVRTTIELALRHHLASQGRF